MGCYRIYNHMIFRKLKLLFYQAIVITGLYLLTNHLYESKSDLRLTMLSALATVIFTAIAITDFVRGPWKKEL